MRSSHTFDDKQVHFIRFRRKSMLLNYYEARMKRESQLIDVLNIVLNVRDINPQNLSDFHNT